MSTNETTSERFARLRRQVDELHQPGVEHDTAAFQMLADTAAQAFDLAVAVTTNGRVWLCTDHPQFRTGAPCAVVIAPDELTARELLQAELLGCGLQAAPFTLTELDRLRAIALLMHPGREGGAA